MRCSPVQIWFLRNRELNIKRNAEFQQEGQSVAMSDHIQISVQDGVQTLTMNRPDKKNALNREMYVALTDALKSADADPAVRVHLIKGLPGAFSSGNDIKEFMEFAASGSLGEDIIAFLKQLVLTEKPIVGVVNGLAIGVGTTMLMHFDLVFATPGSTFRTPFLDLGLVPEAASTLIAPRLMGHQRAFELLCLGMTFSGEDARRAGIVNRLCGPDDIDSEASWATTALASKSPAALAMARKLLKGETGPLLQRIDEEAAQFAKCLQSPDAMEAFSAFIEKRPAKFS